MNVTLTNVTNDPVNAIEEAACNCYNSKPSSNGKIMTSCYKSGHTSVLEFANFTFHIEDVSRTLLAQLTRHRHAGYAVRSQRYCMETDFDYVVPKSIENNELALNTYQNIMEDINTAYIKLIDLGVIAEDARYVLPNACYTTLEVTMNLRALINFMNERLCSRAQWEIRELAQEMRDLIIEIYPQFKDMLVPKCEKYIGFPFCTEQKSCGKHKKLKEVYNAE